MSQSPGVGNKKSKLSRRDLLKIGGGLGLAALFPLGGCGRLQEFEVVDENPLRNYPYRGWEDLYRGQYSWDSVVRSTHSANCGADSLYFSTHF